MDKHRDGDESSRKCFLTKKEQRQYFFINDTWGSDYLLVLRELFKRQTNRLHHFKCKGRASCRLSLPRCKENEEVGSFQ